MAKIIFRKLWFRMSVLMTSLCGIYFASCAQQNASTMMNKPQAGYQRVTVGDIEIIALSDGTIVMTPDELTGASKAEIKQHLKNAHMDGETLHTSVNIYLIKIADRLVLVDAGCGLFYGPSLNKLPASLKSAGYTPDQITDILITHLHDDHAGGLIAGEKRIFPNATVHVEMHDGVNSMMSPYQKVGKLARFEGEAELLPGLRSLPTPGHTRGHSAFVLESNGKKIVFGGDLLHIEEVQFPAPHINVIYDSNPSQAMQQRIKSFDDAAEKGYLVALAHVTFPGIGRLAKDGKGYRFWPLRFVDNAITAPK